MASSNIRLMVVDDSAEFRAVVEQLMAATRGFELVAEAECAEDALSCYGRSKPDVVVMDIRMPGVSGIDATQQLLARDPSARVVLVSAADPDDVPLRAFECGAAAVLGKVDVGRSDFIDLLRGLIPEQ